MRSFFTLKSGFALDLLGRQGCFTYHVINIFIERCFDAAGILRLTLSKMINQRGYNSGTENLDRFVIFFACLIEDLVEHVY